MRLIVSRRGVLLIRNVGEVQELTECPRNNQELLLLQRGQKLIQCLPRITILCFFGTEAYLFDSLEQRLARIIPDDFA